MSFSFACALAERLGVVSPFWGVAGQLPSLSAYRPYLGRNASGASAVFVETVPMYAKEELCALPKSTCTAKTAPTGNERTNSNQPKTAL
jgi:hypothetical protein